MFSLILALILVSPGTVALADTSGSQLNGAEDSDNDGVPDDFDNCIFVFNPDQRDTDGDCFGNICDADLNNDGIVNRNGVGSVNAVDLGLFKSWFFSDNPHADFNGDGVVNVIDLGILRTLFFLPPGPGNCPEAE